MENKSTYSKLLPVLLGFFIMGFVDVVGISTNYVKHDFALSDTLANLLPVMVFFWFAVFSVPTGLMMNKIGRKKTVLISMCITIVALLIPFVFYTFTTALIAFALLGIGNTIIQVSLNPLLSNIVHAKRLTSSLTWGQFIKAIASFLGPIIAGVATSAFGNWKLIFPVFALVTIISTLWLFLTPIEEQPVKGQTSSFKACFGLLKNKTILLFFLGIILIVGIDVGLNVSIPKFLMERCDMLLEKAGLGTSLYFIARTAGTFLGAILLVKLSPRKFLIVSMIAALAALSTMLFMSNVWVILTLIFIIGFSIANVFSILFSAALQNIPERANEVSGLMIMGVSGGAIIMPIMGVASDSIGIAGGLAILLFAMAYLLFCGFMLKKS